MTDDEGRVWEISLVNVSENGQLVLWRFTELIEGQPATYAFIVENPIIRVESPPR